MLASFAVACVPISHNRLRPGPDDGVASEWDVKARMVAMADDVGRFEDLFARVRPNEWIAKGAPDAYLRQLESSKESMQVLIGGDGESRQGSRKVVGGFGRIVSHGQHGSYSYNPCSKEFANIKGRRWRTISPDLLRTMRGIGTCYASTASSWLPREKMN